MKRPNNVKATCETCGSITFSIDELVLILCETPSYRFLCPHCEQIRIRKATEEISNLLITSGAIVINQVGIERRKGSLDHVPITASEVARFGENIANVDVLTKLYAE